MSLFGVIRDAITGTALKINDAGSIDIVWQDSTAPPVDLYFVKIIGAPTTVATATAIDDTSVVLASAAGCSVGDYFGVFNVSGDRNYFGTITAIASNTVTLDTPFDFAYQIGDTAACFDRNLAVDGSVTPQIFSVQVGAGASVSIDITRIMGHLLDSSSMDDAKFGGITGGLSAGLVLRRVDGDTRNIWNVKTNADIGLICFDKTYDDKAPGGQYGMAFRNTFAGVAKHGAVIRLAPGDELQLIIQDDLTGLDDFKVMAQGSFVTD